MVAIDLLNAIPSLITLYLILESWYLTARDAVRLIFRRLRASQAGTPSQPDGFVFTGSGGAYKSGLLYSPQPKSKSPKMSERQYNRLRRQYRKNRQERTSHSAHFRRWASLDLRYKQALKKHGLTASLTLTEK